MCCSCPCLSLSLYLNICVSVSSPLAQCPSLPFLSFFLLSPLSPISSPYSSLPPLITHLLNTSHSTLAFSICPCACCCVLLLYGNNCVYEGVEKYIYIYFYVFNNFFCCITLDYVFFVFFRENEKVAEY